MRKSDTFYEMRDHGRHHMRRGFLYLIISLGRAFILLEILGFVGAHGLEIAHAAGSLPPAAPVATVYQPLNERLEVFAVDTEGALNVVWKANNGVWNSPVRLTAPGFVNAGASVAAIYYPTFQRLEVFVVDKNGVLNVIWKERDGPWNAPVGLTDPGFAPPGARLTAVYQPINEQLEVFVVGVNGALNVIWKDNNGIWKKPFALTQADFAAPSASVGAVYFPPLKQLQVFVVSKGGVLNVFGKENNGAWRAPIGLSGWEFAPSGAPLTAVYQPLNEHLEVFAVDAHGALNVVWKAGNGNWHTPFALTGAGAIMPEASLGSIYYPSNQQLLVFFIDDRGAINVLWKDYDGPWKGPVGVTESHFFPGASVAAAFYARHDQVEAFTTNRYGVLHVEWKVGNKAWAPCPFPLMGTPPSQGTPIQSKVPIVLRTDRIGQLTGTVDPGNLPIMNHAGSGEWQGAGVSGTDLGASTEHDGKLFIFFGDTVPGNPNGSPAWDTDLVAWTSDIALRPGGFTLHPVKEGRFFDPFRVDSIGTLPNSLTPTGAFSYGSRVYVFGLWVNPLDPVPPNAKGPPPTTFLASKFNPSQPGPYFSDSSNFSKAKFWQVAPVVVKNADHPGLPESEGNGLLLFGGGAGNVVSLAWMRIDRERGPIVSSIRYFTGNPDQPWTQAESDAAAALSHESEAKGLMHLPPHYTSVSATWLAEIKQWVLLYSRAYKDAKTPELNNPAGPVVARFGATPWSWGDEVQIFNTCRDRAYGNFMHWGGIDDIDKRVPPNIFGDQPGWAYGAFLMNRFTHWDGAARRLSLAYLISTSNPYQVQVMNTELSLLYVGDYVYLKTFADRLFSKAVQLIQAQQIEEARSVATEAVAVYRLAANADRSDVIAVGQQLLSLSSQWANTSHPPEAVAPAQAAVDVLRDVAPAPGSEMAHLSKLAEAWSTFTLRLIEAGRVEEALQPAVNTVAAYQRIAALPGADVVSIGQQLINLSSHLGNARQPAAAVAPAQAAVDVLRDAAPAAGSETVHLSKLAEAWSTFTLRLIEADRVQDALQPALDTVAAYRRVAALPGADVVSIGQQLINLSSHLGNARQPAAAVAPAQAAVDVLRDAAPAAGSETVHLSKLAEAWSTFTLRLIEADRVQDALQPALDTVAAYRRVAALPGADVVWSAQQLLYLSSHLGTAHQPVAAVAPAQAAVDVLHGVRPAPVAHMAMLAEACHTLALRLKEVGRVREALAPAREGLEIYRQLAIADPETFRAKVIAMEQLVASLEQG
jgi:hypothetical protein